MVLLNVFKLISIVGFVSAASACRANIMEITITKNKIAIHQNLILSSKDVAVLIKVDAKIPDDTDDSVTIDTLACQDVTWNHLVIDNKNFYQQYHDSIANNTVYRFLSTQKLITPEEVTSDVWKWICQLSANWEGHYLVYNFSVKVNIQYNHNNTNDTREKIPLHYQGPAEPKPTCVPTEYKDMNRSSSALPEDFLKSHQQANSAKNHLERTEETFTDRNRIEQTKATDQLDRSDGGMGHKLRFEENNSSNHVGCGEATASTIWVIFSAASVVVFLVGLVIGVFCRHLRAREPEQIEQTDEQTDKHIYDEVDTKGINNRPPLPAPEQAVYIYNSPYDHTLRFQNQTRKI